jgi:redox-sensing transcriptional repressor
LLTEMKIDIAILAIPAEAAQSVADRVVKGGVKAILNFAPRSLSVAPGVTVRQENTTMELEALAYYVKQMRST